MGHGRSEASNHMEVTAMRTKSLFILCSFSLLLAGCYFPITGRVIDAETNAPIEGVVVLVEWTKTHGIGDHSTESYKVMEVLSDKEGKIRLEGCYSPFVNAPHITVYKKGYVAWNDEYIFPGYSKRGGFTWKSNFVFDLSRYDNKYAHSQHIDFIRMCMRTAQNLESKQVLYKAIRWEVEAPSNVQ